LSAGEEEDEEDDGDEYGDEDEDNTDMDRLATAVAVLQESMPPLQAAALSM